MDYRALAELVMMSLFGLSTLVFAVGLSTRLFIAPTLRELFGKDPGAAKDTPLLTAQLSRVEDRLETIERTLDRIHEAQRFDRQLEGPKAG
jgi:hypothetical protein